MSLEQEFARRFEQATRNQPYPFQIRFACEPELPELVDVPTGMGKTAMAVLGWLWRRHVIEPDANTICRFVSRNSWKEFMAPEPRAV